MQFIVIDYIYNFKFCMCLQSNENDEFQLGYMMSKDMQSLDTKNIIMYIVCDCIAECKKRSICVFLRDEGRIFLG
ncbi:hypothetical protein HanRHA438_Chr10g0467291 [Helianthus annuus]|nr:hypothetical protein HanRHA438_Chr10g0467291 [Helianthus annuus]